ncbi:MAG: ABC transporter ATP-binding protein [Planctomycetota bacterium]
MNLISEHDCFDPTSGLPVRGPSLLEIRDVTKYYADGDVTALRGVSLRVTHGEFIAVTGPSGCGKSTLLNLIGALDRPTSGTVWFDGEQVSEDMNLDRLRSQRIGFVFQSFHLLPHLTSLENVQMPMFASERRASERRDRAQRLLEEVGLSDRIDHLPGKLSNGQRQRVAIARALANEPTLLLADEPTGALDSESGAAVMELLRSVCANKKTTLVVVTHDLQVAQSSDRIVSLRDGQIQADDQRENDHS